MGYAVAFILFMLVAKDVMWIRLARNRTPYYDGSLNQLHQSESSQLYLRRGKIYAMVRIVIFIIGMIISINFLPLSL